MAEPKDERIVTRRNTNSSPSASNNNGVGISKLTNVKEEPSVSCSNSNGSDPEAGDSYDVQASLVPVEKRHHLGYYSTRYENKSKHVRSILVETSDLTYSPVH